MKNLARVLDVILVDDDLDSRLVFQRAFDELRTSNNLLMFKNGLEVVKYLEDCEKIPDILFLDLNMPVMDGIEALTHIRNQDCYAGLSIAIYSTSTSNKDMENCLKSGANIYIKKPSDFQKLKEAINKVLKINWQFSNSNLNQDTFLLMI